MLTKTTAKIDTAPAEGLSVAAGLMASLAAYGACFAPEDGTGGEGGQQQTALTGGTPNQPDPKEATDPADAAGKDAAQKAGEDGKTQDSDSEKQGEGPPESYSDFTMPEGFQLNEALLTEATPVFKELGLSQEQAQKLVDLYSGEQQRFAEQQIEQHAETVAQWGEQLRSDPEIGGEKFDGSVKAARALIDQYGSDELKQGLQQTGYGNWPPLVKFVAKLAQAHAPDGFVPGSARGGGSISDPEARAARLYPNSRQS